MTDKMIHQATVIASYGNQCKIETSDKTMVRAKSLKSVGKPLCGDKVKYKIEQNNQLVITEILPRATILSRLNNLNPKPKQIASNIEQMIIVISANSSIKYGLIDRYLVAAEFSGFEPVIVINKIDTVQDKELTYIKNSIHIYENIGIPVFYMSAINDKGIDSLLTVTSDKTNIVVGQSGVGKSSIVNAILPDMDMPAITKEISDSNNKGKHTTTTAYLYTIPNNGKLIDSPGIREFGLWNIDKNDLAKGFTEIQKESEQCKFRNCLHLKEPGCAVLAAVEQGRIHRQRYESYLSIFDSIDT